MEWERIRKRPEDYVGANLQDYQEYAGRFAWAQARALLDGLPNGGINIAFEAVDRHVLAGRGDKLALRWIGRGDQVRDFSYLALRAQINRFANILAERGVAKGDRIFSLLGRVPELYIAALGTLNGDGARRCSPLARQPLTRSIPHRKSQHRRLRKQGLWGHYSVEGHEGSRMGQRA